MKYVLIFSLFFSLFTATQALTHEERHGFKKTHFPEDDITPTTTTDEHNSPKAPNQDHEYQHDHDNQTKGTISSDRFGHNKAIEDFDEHLGFKLSSKAMQNMKVSFTHLNQKGPWMIPKHALVYIKHHVGVYRKRDDWISLVWVNTQQINDTHVSIHTTDLQPSDEVAMSGASFLRMTDTDLNSNTTDSHAH